jgi:hypothetical protein
MEIHVPKPVHGLREAAREIGVISIGILIALGGEQTIEWLHRRAQVAEARETLVVEIAENAARARFNIEHERCLGVRLDQIAAWIDGGPRPPLILRGGLIPYSTSSWTVVKSGVAAHMPLQERVAYSRFYYLIEAIPLVTERENDLWLRLIGYRGAKTLLTPVNTQRILEDVVQARALASVNSRLSHMVVSSAKAIGVDPAPLAADDRSALERSCAAGGIEPRLRPL